MRAGEFPDGVADAAGEDRHGLAQLQPARPGDVPHPPRPPPPHRRHVVHLPDVRLRARPVATRSRASRTRSARWSSRTTARSTTGSSTSWASSAPQQIEFARLNLTYTVMSKRKLLQLVQEKASSAAGTTRACRRSAGMRRRGYTPEAIRDFCDRIGVAKLDSDGRHRAARALRPRGPQRAAPRAMAVLRPAQGRDRQLPRGPGRGARRGQQPRGRRGRARGKVPFSRELYIERDDFLEDPPKKFFRLAPGREVRLRYAYFVTLRRAWSRTPTARSSSCTAPTTRPPRGGNAPDGRKVKGTIHWVSAAHAVDAEVRLYDHLFTRARPRRRARGRRLSSTTSTRTRWWC